MERRVSERLPIWFPLWLGDGQVRDALAIGQDTSRTGIKLASKLRPEVGSQVTVSFRIEDPRTGESELHRATGVVVRVEDNDDPLGLWPHLIMVDLDHPFSDIDVLVASASPMGIH